ncbi:MAG: AbrB/MazE/SpoVT family DNA-binding domain-containing protein [Clostridiaceae bacterium]|jgi:antitoxin MazE
MLVSLISIGNSKGIRLPKAILEQLNIQDTLEMEVEDKQLILKPIHKKPRDGWEKALKEMSANHDDSLLIPDVNETEAFEWEW